MTVNPNNLVQGPAYIYWAQSGTTEPTDASVTPEGYMIIPPAPWTDFGGTTGGVAFKSAPTITDQVVDQIPDPMGGRLTKRATTVVTTLAEGTLQNYNLALNQTMNIAQGTGYQTADPQTATSATQPSYLSLMIYGWAPLLDTGQPALRRIVVRKCLATSQPEMMYVMDKPVGYAVTWTAYYLSQSIPFYHITDELM